jgi:hypothetical protein
MLRAIEGSTELKIQESTKLLHRSHKSNVGSKSEGAGKVPLTKQNLFFMIRACFIPQTRCGNCEKKEEEKPKVNKDSHSD